jgi:hypothetical protein
MEENMSHKRPGFRRLGLMVALLILAVLACNAPVADRTVDPPDASPSAEVPPSPTATPVPAATLSSPQTVPASIETEEAREESGSAAPTFTPIEPPTLAATLTPSATPSRRPTRTPRPATTATADNSGGPLSFTYRVDWRLADASARTAIATVTLDVKGGSGEYTYYRDDLEVDGPVFEYEWATCSGNPGSFRVDSSDGQSTRVDYFETPPCPTMTPTP